VEEDGRVGRGRDEEVKGKKKRRRRGEKEGHR
jgi:hypothetical protein